MSSLTFSTTPTVDVLWTSAEAPNASADRVYGGPFIHTKIHSVSCCNHWSYCAR